MSGVISRLAWAIIAASLMACAQTAFGSDPPLTPTFDADVLPIFKAHCLKCHGPVKPAGKLSLGGARSLARGGAGGPSVIPANPADSPLWDQISSDAMPPKPEESLSALEKATIYRWIEQGATGLPAWADIARSATSTDHWAFAPSARPSPPSVRDQNRIRTPVDRFIQRQLENHKLSFSPDADRITLIRRLSLDLTGIPPTLREIDAFTSDSDQLAYERLVDRLLASPRYGERWGKYWLDAAGYADSNGYFGADSDRPLAYRYRDYIIRAWNRDRPLDQIVREQLAGDELARVRTGSGTPPEIIDLLIATHFLRNGQDGTGESDGNPDEVRADKYAVLEGATQIIGASLLGLTLQCAKCHDHKFEPVTQKDYYQLQAILYPAFNLEHWVLPNNRVAIAGPSNQQIQWQIDDKNIQAQIDALQRTYAAEDTAGKKADSIKPLIETLEAKRQPNPGRVAWVSDVSAEPAQIPLLIRGDLATPGPKVGPGIPAFLSDPEDRYKPTPIHPATPATGRRLALAKWLTRPSSRPSALLARVLANRLWQHHFATGLVATTENLGYTGAPASHPELLDFLAAELAANGWSAKSLHRLIVCSTAYRQSSTLQHQAREMDPDNLWLARYPLLRLDAEAIRDAMLAVSGELIDHLGGPYVPTHRDPSGAVTVDESHPGAHRRSIYLQQRRTQVVSLLEVFDAPSIVNTCTRRLPSTIPPQSLSLLNSSFVITRATRLADRLDREDPDPHQLTTDDNHNARIARAFERILGKPPTPVERRAVERFLADQPVRYPGISPQDAHHRAWADLCQMLLASNAFLYVE